MPQSSKIDLLQWDRQTHSKFLLPFPDASCGLFTRWISPVDSENGVPGSGKTSVTPVYPPFWDATYRFNDSAWCVCSQSHGRSVWKYSDLRLQLTFSLRQRVWVVHQPPRNKNWINKESLSQHETAWLVNYFSEANISKLSDNEDKDQSQ